MLIYSDREKVQTMKIMKEMVNKIPLLKKRCVQNSTAPRVED